MSPEERWLPVAGCEGWYEVSDLGRVRSLDRIVTQDGRWGSQVQRRLRGRLLTPWIDSDGYARVLLGRFGRRAVHRLVAEAFISARPVGMQIRHLDGDAGNNRPENLAWGTTSDNTRDQVRHGRHHEAIRVRCPRSHPLQSPNLLPTQATVGKRSCLACNRAHSEARRRRARGEAVDFQALADEKYAELLRTPGRLKTGRKPYGSVAVRRRRR